MPRLGILFKTKIGKKMQKQKKTTLTESQVKLKKIIAPIVEGIINEAENTSVDSETAIMIIDNLSTIIRESGVIYRKTREDLNDTLVINAINTIVLLKRKLEQQYK
jgi:hypothetical protein